MARINLSIPDPIKAEMDKLELNWSEVARAAFEHEIQLRKSRKMENMNDVIERLRASKKTAEGMDVDSGFKDGQNWARKFASYRLLKRVAALEFHDDEIGFASQLDRALGNSGTDWGDSFWNDVGETEPPNDIYVEAFVAGATDVWEAIEDKI